jgi:ppGpp synthetase/RelA/SpoT-type nucleotidyltranferase
MSLREEIEALRFLMPQSRRVEDWKEQDHPRAVDGKFGTKSEKRAAAHDLPEDPWRYFTKTPGAELVPVAKLQTVRARPEGIANAAKYMAMAYNGEGDKRKPLSVKKNQDGTYTVLDGNSTTAIAKSQRWKMIPVTVEEGSALRELVWLLAEELLGEDFKPGTIRKWRTGPMIKLRDGSWVPYQGVQQAKKAAPPKKPEPVAKVHAHLAAIADLQARGQLPKDHTPEEHKEIAVAFLQAHSDTLQEAVDRLQAVAVGDGTAVSGRVKEVESAIGKLVKKPKYGTVEGLKDGSGLRVVCESVADVLASVKAIKARFKTSAADEEDYINNPKEGYRSYHLVIEDEDGLWKEVQVRTPNQDTWANWCHDVYKPESAEQSAAMAASKDEILGYGRLMSDYYWSKDRGQPPPPPPTCPPVVQATFGCMPI